MGQGGEEVAPRIPEEILWNFPGFNPGLTKMSMAKYSHNLYQHWWLFLQFGSTSFPISATEKSTSFGTDGFHFTDLSKITKMAWFCLKTNYQVRFPLLSKDFLQITRLDSPFWARRRPSATVRKPPASSPRTHTLVDFIFIKNCVVRIMTKIK